MKQHNNTLAIRKVLRNMELLPRADTSSKKKEVKCFSLNRHHTFHILYVNFCVDWPLFGDQFILLWGMVFSSMR